VFRLLEAIFLAAEVPPRGDRTAAERCLEELERVGDRGLKCFDGRLIPRVEWLS
jgi:ubiquitin